MPSGIQLSSGVLVGAQTALDAKYGPYDSIALALGDITSEYRYQGLTVGIKSGGSVAEYWFKSGVENSDFVQKAPGDPFVFTVAANGQSIPTNHRFVRVIASLPSGAGAWTLTLPSSGAVEGDEVRVETGLVDGSPYGVTPEGPVDSRSLTLTTGGGGGGGASSEGSAFFSGLGEVLLSNYETLVARFSNGKWRLVTRDTFVSSIGLQLNKVVSLEGLTYNNGYRRLSVEAKNLVSVVDATVPQSGYVFPAHPNLRVNATTSGVPTSSFTSGDPTALLLPYTGVAVGDRIEVWLVGKAGNNAHDVVEIKQALVPDTVENGTLLATLDTVGQSALFIRESSGWTLYPTRIHDHDERYYTEDETDALLARKVADYGPPTWVRTSSRDNSPSDLGIVAAISWDGIVWHSTTKSKLFPADSFSRDASVFWHQPTSRWVCFSTNAFGGTKSFQVATSPDLRTWTVITVPLVGPLTDGTANNTWLNHHFIDNGNYYALVRLSTTAGNNYGAPGCGYTRCLNPGTWTQWTNWTPFDSTVRVDANEMCIIKKGDLYHMFSLPGTHLNLTPPGLPNYYDIHVQTSTQPFGGYSAPVNVTAPARAALGSFFIEGCDIVHIKGDHYRLYFQEGVTNEAWVWDSYDGMQTWDLESLRALQYIGLDGRGHGTVARVTTQNIRSIQATIRQLAEPLPHTHPNATTSEAGFMSSADKTKLDNVANSAQVTAVTGTAPIVSSGGTTPAISISAATTSAAGSMSSADKTKLDGIAAGAEVNVNADWNATTGDAQILNKPSFNTGKTIYVDAVVGTDTRTGLSQYDASKPFLTIEAAVAASAIGDLVWVRKGSYTISASISLDNKGDIQCEAGTIITITGDITAFTTSQTKTIIGDTFILSNTAKMCSVSGGTLRLEFANLSSTSTGTLFTVTAGTIDMQFAYIVATSARAFELTGSGGMRIRRSHSVSCQQFLYANTTGGATIDLWTVIGNSPDSVFYIDNIVGLSYRGVNCNGSVGQNTYSNGYAGSNNWASNLAAQELFVSVDSIRLDSEGSGGFGYAINNATAQITSPSRYSFGSKLKWNASNLAGYTWYGVGGLVLSQGTHISQNYLFIGLQPVLDDTWARPFIEYRLGSKTGSNIVYTTSTWDGLVTTLDNNGAIRLQNQATPAVITIIKTARDSLKIIINSPLDGDRIITCKFTTQETINAFNSLTNFGYADYLSDWTFSDQSIEGNLAPTIFFNYPHSTAGGGPISEINPVLRNIRVNVANPITPATILTTNDQRYFYLDNVKIASWENRLSFDSLVANTPVVAYNVFGNRPVSSNVSVSGVYTQIASIF